jgi:glc operon protein GlcG
MKVSWWAHNRHPAAKGAAMPSKSAIKGLVVLLFVMSILGSAVAQMPNAYGPSVTLETARKVAAPALAEAAKNNWNIAVAVVDTGGNLVYYEKMDNTQLGSAHIAVEKARTAAMFKRPTKAFQDSLATGAENLRILGLPGIVPAEGGFPLLIEGKIVGAIGVSGMSSAQDAQCAKVGADSLK